MLCFNYLFIKLLILYLYTTVNYCVEFTDFIRNLICPQGRQKRRGSKTLFVSLTRFPFKAQN